MAKVNSDWCTLVELKYFLGLTDDEAADMLGVKVRTMQRMWSDAREWLYEQAPEEDARVKPGAKAKSATS